MGIDYVRIFYFYFYSIKLYVSWKCAKVFFVVSNSMLNAFDRGTKTNPNLNKKAIKKEDRTAAQTKSKSFTLTSHSAPKREEKRTKDCRAGSVERSDTMRSITRARMAKTARVSICRRQGDVFRLFVVLAPSLLLLFLHWQIFINLWLKAKHNGDKEKNSRNF